MLTVATSSSYIGHIHFTMYVFHWCKRQAFHTLRFSNVYMRGFLLMSAMWVNYSNTTFRQFVVACKKSYRILNKLPMTRGASLV